MNDLMTILVQIVFAAFCFLCAQYIGRLRLATNQLTTESTKIWGLKADFFFDIAMLMLAVGFGVFVQNLLLSIVFVLIYRLVFTKTVNLVENNNFFYLDDNKRIDHFLRFALLIRKGNFSPAAGLIEVVILVAAIVLINLFLL